MTNTLAIVLKADDFRDSDKRLTLLSPTEGVLSAVLRGVKKSGARLRFAAQPFALCQLEIADKGGVVTSAELVDDLRFVTQDYDRYTYACLMGEASMIVARSIEQEVFLALLKALKDLLTEELGLVAKQYIQTLFALTGLGQRTFPSLKSAIAAFERTFECFLKSAKTI